MVKHTRYIPLLGFFLLMLAGCGPGAPQGVGGLVVRPASLDFGVIGSLAPVETTVELVNTGRTAIEIRGVEGGCQCTVPRLEVSRIPPGGSVALPVRYNPADRIGPQHEQVTITMDGYAVFLPVRVHVEDSLELTPGALDIQARFGAEAQTSDLQLDALGDVPFRVTRVEAPDFLTLDPATIPEPTYSAHFTVALAPGLAIGARAGTIVLHTTDPAQPIVHVAVNVNLRGALVAQPQAVVLGGASSAPGEPATVRITRHDGEPFTIARVEPVEPNPPFAIEFDSGSGVAHDLTLRPAARPGAPSTSTATIRINGDPARGEELILSVVTITRGAERKPSRSALRPRADAPAHKPDGAAGPAAPLETLNPHGTEKRR